MGTRSHRNYAKNIDGGIEGDTLVGFMNRAEKLLQANKPKLAGAMFLKAAEMSISPTHRMELYTRAHNCFGTL